MTDLEIYECYKGYYAEIKFSSPTSGGIQFEFPNYCEHLTEGGAPAIEYYFYTPFTVTPYGHIIFTHGVPEFVYKEVCEEIRRLLDEADQFLWGV
jgi:hypothetical protein